MNQFSNLRLDPDYMRQPFDCLMCANMSSEPPSCPHINNPDSGQPKKWNEETLYP